MIRERRSGCEDFRGSSLISFLRHVHSLILNSDTNEEQDAHLLRSRKNQLPAWADESLTFRAMPFVARALYLFQIPHHFEVGSGHLDAHRIELTFPDS